MARLSRAKAIRFPRVVRSGRWPAVGRRDCLVKLSMELAQIRVRPIVDLVVELRQPDLAITTNLGAESEHFARDSTNRIVRHVGKGKVANEATV